LGSLLEGINSEEHVYFWVGKGRNGKGTMDTALKEAIGDYYHVLSNDYFVLKNKNKNGADPLVLGMKNKRGCVTQETEDSQTYYTSIIKGLVGNDALSGRQLYSGELQEFDPTFKNIICTNWLPNFTDIDEGLLDRIRVIEFPYTFKFGDEYNENNPTHKKGDNKLKDILKKEKGNFIHFLIKYYKIYKEEGLTVPPEIKKSIENYRENIDTVQSFMNNQYIKTNDQQDSIDTQSLADHHDRWAPQKLGQVKFTQRLKTFACVKRIVKNGMRRWSVIGYKYLPEELPEE